jgi:tetratricopeptide (TPR) repeat protein
VSRQKPHLIVGWLWYLGSLVPVIGLIQVGQQAMADRYSYLPLVGPFIALAWELRDLGRRRASWRGPLWIGATAAVGCYALAARAQLEHWRDGETVAQRAVSVTRDNYVMHYNLAYALFEKGEVERAIPHYAEAVRLQPRQASFHGNLAVALAQVDRVDEAVLHYRRALELAPTDAAAYNNLAWLLATHPEATRRRPAEALRLAEMAQRLAGDRPGILDTLAAAQAAAGQFQAATRTARMGVLLARKAGQESLARELERRLVFYERAQPYREHPGAAVFPLLQPSS